MKKFKFKQFIRQAIPFFIAIISFSVMVISALSYANSKKDSWEKDVKTRLFEILMTKKTGLEKSLYSRIHYTRSVAAYVSLKPDISVHEYYNLANELIGSDSVISTMGLSRGCIIGAIYPLKGHEAAIGLNLLAHPARKEIVLKTIKTRDSFIAGPVELIEGGVAFISYTPIFDKTVDHKGAFWGVIDIVIYQKQLLEQAGLNEKESGFLFALRGYNGLGDKGAIWWGNEKVFRQNPVTVKIDIPNGNWILAAVPEIGWNSYLNQDHVLLTLLIISSFVISVLIWLFSRAMAKIRRNEQELKAIFQSMDSLILEFDHEGKFIKIPLVNSALLFKHQDELINKTVFDIFPLEMAEMFHHAILECLKTKKTIEMEYSLPIKGKEIWFSAKISRKSENRVILHAFDTTEKRNNLEKLKNSELQFKKLNAEKDKFFSIIAHDLKSPFNSIVGLSEVLVKQVNEKNYNGIEEYSGFILQSSQRAMDLLVNLMEWAQSQTGRMEFNPKNFDLVELINEVQLLFAGNAQQKDIKIKTNLPENIPVFADKAMISTVVRNLISNAIKFTFPGGEILISTELNPSELIVSVMDTGMGISEDRLGKLFRIAESYSTPGTDREKGTGLGLILCNEFVKKHGGNISVVSEEGKGSTFSFILPFK